jgi:hypothetical protein
MQLAFGKTIVRINHGKIYDAIYYLYSTAAAARLVCFSGSKGGKPY